jgi:hypothetical protein
MKIEDSRILTVAEVRTERGRLVKRTGVMIAHERRE